MTERMRVILALALLVVSGIGGISTAVAQESSGDIDCSQYMWQEDAELGEEQHDICLDLPSISEAPTCADFSTQAEAQELFSTNPYGYRMLTPYGSGTGEDSTTACPELSADTGTGGGTTENTSGSVTGLPSTGTGDVSNVYGHVAVAGIATLIVAAYMSRRFATTNR